MIKLLLIFLILVRICIQFDAIMAVNQHWYDYPLLNRIKPHPDTFRSFEEICINNGYNVSTHWVKTQDNFINKMFRITKGEQTSQKPSVLLVHGIIASGEIWIVNEKEKAQAFILAEEGYDVWVANFRGNMHSQLHENLDPLKDKSYWDQPAPVAASQYDMIAFIDYAKFHSGVKKITIICHSQGSQMTLNLMVSHSAYVR